MKKEDLRIVQFKDPNISPFNYGVKDGANAANGKDISLKTGLFHGWEKQVDEETRNEITFGLIEREDSGQMVKVLVENIKFIR